MEKRLDCNERWQENYTDLSQRSGNGEGEQKAVLRAFTKKRFQYKTNGITSHNPSRARTKEDGEDELQTKIFSFPKFKATMYKDSCIQPNTLKNSKLFKIIIKIGI